MLHPYAFPAPTPGGCHGHDQPTTEAPARGRYEIVHSLTTETWGVRRFWVRAPDGTVVNIVRHRE